MNLPALDIPESPRDIAQWLERHLRGADLGRLAAEFAAVNPPAADPPTLAEILGPQADAVLRQGLTVLPEPALRRLLANPVRLLELQVRVFTAGGPYWDAIQPQSEQIDEWLASGRTRLAAIRHRETPPSEPLRAVRGPWLRHPLVVSMLAAAAALIGVMLFNHGSLIFAPAPQPAAWGWSAPDALPGEAPREQYFKQLADGAEQWFKQRPETAPDVARRILEFRQGCNRLIMAEHASLSPADRDWLKERCRAWAAKLDAHIEELEAGGRSPLHIRDEADETIRTLTTALRQRAA